jgi:hypothetical protein
MIMFKHTLVTMAIVAPLIAAANPGVNINSQEIENFTRKGDKVGDYEPLEAEQIFSPANACIVDKDGSFTGKLKQCKEQRLGWLKI